MTRPVVVRGDARRLPLPDGSVDLIVTSPPYFALRSYTDGGEHYAGQVGAEATPAEYIAALVACTREWMRVLKDGGAMFVNLGDKYSTGNSGQSGMAQLGQRYAGGGHSDGKAKRASAAVCGMPPKSLLLLPERYRIACVDELGLIARAVIVWSKPNGLPESVTDRVRRSHEDWVHLAKQPRYFAAVDGIREPHAPNYARKYPNGQGGQGGNPNRNDGGVVTQRTAADLNPLGKLPGSVWEVATEPLKVPERLAVDHFAAFPSEWPRRLILGWSPAGICTACGEGRRPVVQRQTNAEAWAHLPLKPGEVARLASRPRDADPLTDALASGLSRPGWRKNLPEPTTITGYACACPDDTAPTRPAVVLDPFGGTGTTAHVAAALGRVGVTVDLSADYCRLAAAPELADARRRKVLDLDPVPVRVRPGDGQGDLFGGDE